MKDNHVIVACVAAGMAAAPFCAYISCPRDILPDGSLDEWFDFFLTNQAGFPKFRLAVFLCAGFGLVVGLLLRPALGSAEPKKEFELALLRTQLFAMFLIPMGVITILLLACSRTPQAFVEIIQSGLSPYIWIIVVVFLVFAPLGSWIMGGINGMELSFEKAFPPEKMWTLCCWPVAIFVGLLHMAGEIGCGLLLGAILGRHYGWSILGGWQGTCIAVFYLAYKGAIFWPIYFPMSRVGQEED
jgi:hypothetical protein